MDALRQFQRAATFRVAMQDLTGRLPLMQVSDRLTDVAELILEQALALAWRHTAAQYGEPRCEDAAGRPDRRASASRATASSAAWSSATPPISTSCSCTTPPASGQQTAGPKVVDNEVFFLRLAQRLVHLLTVHTAAGRLYEVDVRLRPSGKGGLAFTQIGAFEDYQRREAWTWEHQALLHSRWVAGDAGARRAPSRRIRTRRADRGGEARDAARGDRRACASACAASTRGRADEQFDLKQDRGGIADIEFLAQYWVLCARRPNTRRSRSSPIRSASSSPSAPRRSWITG